MLTASDLLILDGLVLPCVEALRNAFDRDDKTVDIRGVYASRTSCILETLQRKGLITGDSTLSNTGRELGRVAHYYRPQADRKVSL